MVFSPLLPAASEEDILKGKQSLRSQALGNQNSESETLLDTDDDTLSSLEEKDLENLTGKHTSRPLHLPHLSGLPRSHVAAPGLLAPPIFPFDDATVLI